MKPWTASTLLALLAIFVALPVSAAAPAGRYSVTNDTVRDNRTGLTWQRVSPESTYTQAAAATYCGDLVLASLSDWRLPNKAELESIVDDTRFNPALDISAFPGISNFRFWTSTPVAGNPLSFWTVYFGSGVSLDDAVSTDPNNVRVRCVR